MKNANRRSLEFGVKVSQDKSDAELDWRLEKIESEISGAQVVPDTDTDTAHYGKRDTVPQW